MPRMKLIEQVNLSPSQNLDQVVREAFKGELPESLYPEIKAISASKVTRNKTFYPTESLIGDKSKGNGINSILFPYPIPIIKDHATGGGFLSSGSSPIYGRARYARFLKEDNGKGYVSVIPEITDPEAIKMILTERFLTVSIGVETESVHCSICNIDLSTGVECEHKKGNTYFIDGKPLEAYWKIGPVWFQEISFVTVPSDTDAQVINKNVKLESLKVFGGKMESGKEIFLESFAGYDDAKRMWSMPIKENKETINENINNSIEDEDRILTLGELYNLNEDDPEFSIEAKLNAKQRKALPDSSFCGPGRSFPAHDACLTGETRISLLDGTSIEIRNIEEELKNKKLWTYGFNLDTKSIVPAEITQACKTLENAPILKITLDNGESIRCTGNHPFLLKCMEYKNAEDLAVGDSLMPLYTKFSTIRDSLAPYKQVLQPWYRYWELEHHMVAREVFNRPISEDEVVHHKNENRIDNTPSNLEYMSRKDHITYHSIQKPKKTITTKQKEVQSNFTKERMKYVCSDKEKYKEHIHAISKGKRSYNWDEPTLEIKDSGLNLFDVISLLNNGVTKKQLCKFLGNIDPSTISRWIEKSKLSDTYNKPKHNKSDVYMEVLKSSFKEWFGHSIDDIYRDFCENGLSYVELSNKWKIDRTTLKTWFEKFDLETNKAKISIYRINETPETLYSKWINGKVSKNWLVKNLKVTLPTINKVFSEVENDTPINHKITSIEFDGYEDVYDITVPYTSNFGLESGIFVHNSHTSVGLRLLGRYKGPGDKNRIKSCLLRKAASFRKKENSEHLALGYLRDEKFGVEFPLFKVNQSTIIPVFESLRNSLFPEETKIGMYKTLANICKKNKWYRPSGLEEIYQTIEISKEEYPPVIIELNKETYPLLYNFIDVIETQIWEDYMKDDINKDPKDEGIKEEIEKEKTEESNFNIEEIKHKIQEELENKYKKEYENKVKELEANSITQEQYEILNEKCIESYSVAHVRLAGQVAILAKVLRKPISKEKSIVDITREYSKRSTTSLEDTLSDLLLEYDGSTPVDIEKVEKVENPATIENERAISMIAIDPKTQKPTLVSDIKEEEDETFYLRYNIDPKRVEQRIKQHASSL